MAELNVADKRTASGSPTHIGSQMYSVIYDFDADGGTSADTRVLVDFKDASAVCLKAVRVRTALTSGGAATISLGVEAGTEFFSAEAIATFAAGAIVNADDPGAFFKVEDDESLIMAIGTADLTAGKLEFLFEAISA